MSARNPAQGPPGQGREVKLPPFKPPQERGKKSLSTRKRAADGPSWTPSELRMRNKLLKLNLGIEGNRGNSDQFRDGWALAFGKTGDETPEEVEARWRERLEIAGELKEAAEVKLPDPQSPEKT